MRRAVLSALVLCAPLAAHAGGWASLASTSSSSGEQTDWWTETGGDSKGAVSYGDWLCGTCDEVAIDLDQAGYEDLLDDLNTGRVVTDIVGDDGLDLEVIPQLWEGTSGQSVVQLGVPVHVGNVHTDKDGDHWTETWVLFDREAFAAESSLAWDGPELLEDYQPIYAADPASPGYTVLEFDYVYRTPPSSSAIASLPDTVPTFVTETTVYEVVTVFVASGEEELTGGLHRQHYEAADGSEWWRDTWVLWDDYVRPVGPDVATELRVQSTEISTVRSFLEDQASHPQHAFVQTTATPTSL